MMISKINDLLSLNQSKIAFFSGSFDPIHHGHVEVIEFALDNYVDIVVICIHSHNTGKKLSPIEYRLEVIKRILPSSRYYGQIFFIKPACLHGIENDRFICLNHDLANKGAQVFILRGQDSLLGRKNYPLGHLPHIIVNRGRIEHSLDAVLEGDIIRVDHISGMSSTEARKRLAGGEKIYACDDLHDFIITNGHYSLSKKDTRNDNSAS